MKGKGFHQVKKWKGQQNLSFRSVKGPKRVIFSMRNKPIYKMQGERASTFQTFLVFQ